jgi:hypothetical protein
MPLAMMGQLMPNARMVVAAMTPTPVVEVGDRRQTPDPS